MRYANAVELYMADRLRRGQAEHGEKWDPSALVAAEHFARHYAHGLRVRVRRTYPDGDTWQRTGVVSTTTGWRPAFLLMHRSNAHGSWDVLGPEDKVVAVQRHRGGFYTEEG